MNIFCRKRQNYMSRVLPEMERKTERRSEYDSMNEDIQLRFIEPGLVSPN